MHLSRTAASKFNLPASGARGITPSTPWHLCELKEHTLKVGIYSNSN